MNIELTERIVSQAETFGVMLAAGILTESLWQIKSRVQRRIPAAGGRTKPGKGIETEKGAPPDVSIKAAAGKILTELLFWAAAAAVLSGFLYYCAYGKLSLHAAAGFLVGLLLWKKIFTRGIMSAWVRNDEAQSSKTTARLSTWRRPGGSARRGDRQRRTGKKRN